MDDVEAEEKILTKTILLNFFLQVLISCCNQPYIDGYRPAPADPFHFTFLQNTKKFGLSCHAEIADFVEKQRSAVGRFDPANAALDTRRHTFFDAEQFAFNQGFRQGSTVYGYKGLRPAMTLIVNGARR